jgi:CDGSH-type Zn-finger protein
VARIRLPPGENDQRKGDQLTMEKPRIAERRPAVMETEPGRHLWCACGLSQQQPFCDGSHKGTGLAPKVVELTASERIAWCQCKRTGNPPFCDGTHKTLPEEG